MGDETTPPNAEALAKSLANIAVESWRFGKTFQRVLGKLDAGEQSKFLGQFRWFQRKLEGELAGAGMRIVNVEGHGFDPGMAATPINAEEFESSDELVVEQMLEPIIMGQNGVVKTGTVILGRAKS